jgi:hypothetical protein
MHARYLVAICVAAATASAATNEIPNHLIDYDAFRSQVVDVGRLRETRRVTEDAFIQMAAEPGTVVLDARSRDKYAKLHVKGAKHLGAIGLTPSPA